MIDEVCHDSFRQPVVVDYYAKQAGLIYGEETLFAELASKICGARVLDIGIGCGRTTPYLLHLKPESYVGVDYVSEMVEKAKINYPGVDFRVADARKMNEFKNEEFDVALFSWNGIDYVDHTGRLAILAEVKRILSPGGRFAFSTGNGRKHPPKPWSLEALRNMEIRMTPRGIIYAAKEFILSCRNYWQRAGGQIFGKDYVIRLDPAHGFRLLRYFISPENQQAQLQTEGFQNIRLIDRFGNFKDINDPAIDTATVYYLCEKPE